MSNSNLRILFFGTPDFAAESLQKLFDANYTIVGVVTAPDKAAGRGMKIQSSTVKQVAQKLGIPVFQPNNLKSSEFIDTIKILKVDLGIVIAFRMLPEIIWSAPKYGTINLHGSLLPKYRGAAPIQHAIIQGETTTGLTVFFLRHEIDTGDILMTKEIQIGEYEDFGSLYNRLKMAGGDLIVKCVEAISQQNYVLTPQKLVGEPSFAPKITKEFCRLDVNETCLANFNKIRGLSPLPGAYVEFYGELIKIYSALLSSVDSISNDPIQVIGKKVFLKCKDGCLEIISLQFAGKPRIMGVDYVNGMKNR